MTNPWFESVAEAQRRARKVLPKSVYSALLAGSERGVTVDDNVAAFAELGFAPLHRGPARRPRSQHHVMGQDLALPVLISPTGVQAVHPDGEVAVARAAAARGTAMGLSSFASKPVEEVVAANPKTFFQLYWSGSRTSSRNALSAPAPRAAVGLIATLDWSFSMGRDWGSPHIPEHINVKEALRFAPQAIARPRWLAHVARTRWIPDLTVPNMQTAGRAGTDVLRRLRRVDADPTADVGTTSPGCAENGTVRSWSKASPASTRHGARSTPAPPRISVSNHGGNNLDGTPATIRAAAGHRRRRRRSRSRSCSTAASAAAATSSRPSPSAPAPS